MHSISRYPSSALAPRGFAAALVLAFVLMNGCSSTAKRGHNAPPKQAAPAPVPPATAPAPQSAPAPIASETPPPTPESSPAAPAPAEPGPGGRYYMDDGPHADAPPDLEKTPDAQPRAEPLNRAANQPYVVFGEIYRPMPDATPYRARGIASWYGRKFHGKPTATGEIYDMFQMTAAHTTLPLPTYARVTNLANGKSVVVRVNDRGPFLHKRVIDLSYAAALKLGYAERGSAEVEVERIVGGNGPTAPGAAIPAATSAVKDTAAQAPLNESGYFLQLGAFSGRSSAESFRVYLRKEASFVKELADIFLKDGLFRVRLGPYVSRRQARAVASRIERATDLSPLVSGPD
jgi:rare lipoprotein A